MGLKCYINILCIWALPLVVFSQTDTVKKTQEYIKSFPDAITIRPFFLQTSNSYIIGSLESDDKINLTANKQDRIGATVSFRSAVLSYSFAPDFLSTNSDNENSKLFNLNFRTFIGRWMQTFILFDEKGFFFENNNVSVYLPATSSFKVGGSTAYILNSNFSFKAITSQNEKQLKSIGSFIPRVVYFYSEFKIGSETANTLDIISYDFAVAPSYYYNWIPVKNLLLSGGISAGIGFNVSESEGVVGDGKSKNTITSLLTEVDFRGSIIYDKNNLYIGASYNHLILNHNSGRDAYIEDSIPTLELFFGYRFDAPKSMIKLADKVNSTFGL